MQASGLRISWATLAGDLPQITEIYEDAVLNGTPTYEQTPPDLAEMTARFEALAAGPIHFFQFLCGNIDDIIAIQLDGFVGRKPEPLDAEITGIAENRGMNGTIVCVEIDVFEILDDIIVGIADERFGTCVDIDDLVGFGIDNDDADGKRIEQDIVDAAISREFALGCDVR